MVPTTRELGCWAEQLAEKYLRDQGLKSVMRNFRSRFGEIDLVMRDGAALVFVEVRYRSNPNFGDGADSVDGRKQRRLLATAEHYLQRFCKADDVACRFDVVSVTTSGGDHKIRWIADAFSADGYPGS